MEYGAGSHILTADRAHHAIDLVLPMIHGIVAEELVKRADLHIVIMNPTAIFGAHDPMGSILCQHSLGDTSKWIHPYDQIARRKAFISWRTGLASSVVQHQRPHLFPQGYSYFGGGVIHEGIVVACSGAQWYFDQMFAYWIAATCQALCIQQMQEVQIPGDNDTLI